MSDLCSGAVAVTRRENRTPLLWAGRTVFDVVLGGEHTGGSFALLDQTGDRGDATPMHVHRTDAEVLYVLDGAITAWAGDDATELGCGSAVYLPPGLAHAFRVEQDGTRVFTVTAPAGFADFVREAAIPCDAVPATRVRRRSHHGRRGSPRHRDRRPAAGRPSTALGVVRDVTLGRPNANTRQMSAPMMVQPAVRGAPAGGVCRMQARLASFNGNAAYRRGG